MTTNSSSGDYHVSLRHMTELAGQHLKTVSPLVTYFAMINLTPVKDVVSIIGGLVAIVCTILVARSQIRKNNSQPRERSWVSEGDYDP